MMSASYKSIHNSVINPSRGGDSKQAHFVNTQFKEEEWYHSAVIIWATRCNSLKKVICQLLIGQFLDFQTKIENKYCMDFSIGQNMNCQTMLYMCHSAIGSNNSIFWRENIGIFGEGGQNG